MALRSTFGTKWSATIQGNGTGSLSLCVHFPKALSVFEQQVWARVREGKTYSVCHPAKLVSLAKS